MFPTTSQVRSECVPHYIMGGNVFLTTAKVGSECVPHYITGGNVCGGCSMPFLHVLN